MIFLVLTFLVFGQIEAAKILFNNESFLNLVERNLFPNESCDFFFWTSDNSSMIKKHFEALQMYQPLMSFTRLPTLTKSGVSVKRLFSKSYVEMIFKVRRNFCTILVLENPLLINSMLAYAYPWQNPLIVVLGKLGAKIEGPRLPIVQIHNDLIVLECENGTKVIMNDLLQSKTPSPLKGLCPFSTKNWKILHVRHAIPSGILQSYLACEFLKANCTSSNSLGFRQSHTYALMPLTKINKNFLQNDIRQPLYHNAISQSELNKFTMIKVNQKDFIFWQKSQINEMEILPQYLDMDLSVISRHPTKVSKFGIVLLPFDYMTWIFTLAAISTIFVFIKVTQSIYENTTPDLLLRRHMDTSELLIRLFAGFTEPDSVSWFSRASAGLYLTVSWIVLSLFMNFAYQSVLRNQLIRPQFSKHVNTLEDAEFLTRPMFVPFEIGYMYKLNIPFDVMMNSLIYDAKHCDVHNGVSELYGKRRKAISSIMSYYVRKLNLNAFKLMMELMENYDLKALAGENFFSEMTDAYRKFFPRKGFPFRMSKQPVGKNQIRIVFQLNDKQKLPRAFIEEYIKAYVKAIESGIPKHFDKGPIYFDTNVNPYLELESEEDKKVLGMFTFIDIILFYGFMCFISAIAFIHEISTCCKCCNALKWIKPLAKAMKMHRKIFIIGLILICICGIISTLVVTDKPTSTFHPTFAFGVASLPTMSSFPENDVHCFDKKPDQYMVEVKVYRYGQLQGSQECLSKLLYAPTLHKDVSKIGAVYSPIPKLVMICTGKCFGINGKGIITYGELMKLQLFGPHYVNLVNFKNSSSGKLWATGGLGKFKFEGKTRVVEMKDYPVFNTFGPEMPGPRVLHCMLAINQSHFFLHGGRKPTFPRKKNRPIFYTQDKWKADYRIWNFRGIDNETDETSYIFNWEAKQWKKVNNPNPCGYEDPKSQSQCSLRIDPNTGNQEIIIPTRNMDSNGSCTDILDLSTLEWKTIPNDNRVAIHGGFSMSHENETKVYYLGGLDKNGNPMKTIYEFVDEESGWKRIFPDLPFPMGGSSNRAFPIEKDFCSQNMKQNN